MPGVGTFVFDLPPAGGRPQIAILPTAFASASERCVAICKLML
jgi:hypothetical protein